MGLEEVIIEIKERKDAKQVKVVLDKGVREMTDLFIIQDFLLRMEKEKKFVIFKDYSEIGIDEEYIVTGEVIEQDRVLELSLVVLIEEQTNEEIQVAKTLDRLV